MNTEEIFEQMLAAFSAETGYGLREDCDLAVRLYAAAAQLETLYQYADWSRRQAFPQTAAGEYLDYHGQMRNLTREGPVCAAGQVTIRLDEQYPEELRFPEGMTLLTQDDRAYTLDTEVLLPAGNVECTANVTAEQPGTDGNLPAGTGLSFSSGPACVASVTAENGLAGGADAEDDEHFRARVLASFRPSENGAGAAFYRTLARSVDGIVACGVLPGENGPLSVGVCVASESGAPSARQLNRVNSLLAEKRELGVTLRLTTPTLLPLDCAAQLRCADGVPFAEAAQAAEAAIRGYFTGERLGAPVYASQLAHLVFQTGLVQDCVITLDPSAETVAWNVLPQLDTLSVTEAA